MTAAALSALLVVLVGARVRLRPRARVPGCAAATPPAIPDVDARAPSGRTAGPGEVAAWCDRLARATRTGSTLTAAVREVEPPAGCTDHLDELLLRLDRGAPLGAAASIDAAGPHLEPALVVVRACAEHGGSPAEPLDRVAAMLRARAVDLAERRSQSAQARLSALVMTLLPLAMLALLLLTSAAVRGVVSSPVGLATVGAGATLNLAGWRWMRRLINGAPT